MKKKVLTMLTGAMLATSVSFAAPLTDVQQNQTAIGYNHYNLEAAGHSTNSDSFYLENGIADRVIVGIEKNSKAPLDTTDVYAHYKLDPNIRLIVGNRSYDNGPNKMFYGIGGNVNLASNLDGYASVTSSSVATEWQTGVNYSMNSQVGLHVGYKSYKQDGLPTVDGVGFGANYKF